MRKFQMTIEFEMRGTSGLAVPDGVMKTIAEALAPQQGRIVKIAEIMPETVALSLEHFRTIDNT